MTLKVRVLAWAISIELPAVCLLLLPQLKEKMDMCGLSGIGSRDRKVMVAHPKFPHEGFFLEPHNQVSHGPSCTTLAVPKLEYFL